LINFFLVALPPQTLDTLCAILDGLSTAQLDKMYLGAAKPSAQTGFPLRGCTYGCEHSSSSSSCESC
jgi:hypothetical protein